jgi:hypothetical protein
MISYLNGNLKRYYNEAILKGKLEGIKEGKLRGKLEGKLETAKRLLDMKLDADLIAEATGLPLDKIERLKLGCEQEEVGTWQMKFFQELPVDIRKKLIGEQDFNLNDPEVIRMLSAKMGQFIVEFYDRCVLSGRVMAKTAVMLRMAGCGVAKDLVKKYIELTDEEREFIFGEDGDFFDDVS